MKNFFIVCLISVLSVLVSIGSFEIFASYNSNLFPSFGWQTNNVMSDKVKKCNQNNNIGVFGDSFVEYFGKNKSNITVQLNNKFKNNHICNFGISGSDISEYINRFLFVIENKVQLDKAIFYLTEVNDFHEFRYHDSNQKIESITIGNFEIFNYSSNKINERKLSRLKNLIKSTYSFNLIYRYFVKKYFFYYFYNLRINETFVKRLYSKNLYYEIPLDEAINKMKNFSKKYKRLVASDILNLSFYTLALRNPSYFNQVHSPTNEQFYYQKQIAKKHLDFINFLCEENKIECKFIIIPDNYNLFKKTKKIYSEMYGFYQNDLIGKSRIVKFLLENYDNVFYPDQILLYDDYIVNDMHTNGKGNKKLADFTFRKF